LFHRSHGLPCVVLRTSRFFPQEDDNPVTRLAYDDGNVKANEFLYRRVDVQDAVVLDLLAWGEDYRSPLGRAVGSKGYYAHRFSDGPYPTS
jgi:hypothetical protein